MLTGEFRHTLDAKGRVFVPAKFRTDLGQSFVVARGFGKFLVAYSEPEWEKFIAKLDTLGQGREAKEMKRYIMKSAMPTELDNQGRISVVAEHRAFAGLTKEISFLGMGTYVEIWNTGELETETDAYDTEKFENLLETI